MAGEEIIQTMGLDARTVLNTVNQLNQSYATLEGRINSLASTLNSFNKAGEAHLKVLRQISNAMQRSIRVATTGSGAKPKANAPSLNQGINNPATPFNPQQAAQAGQGIDKVIGSLNQLGKAGEQNIGSVNRQTRDLTVSWETLTRVVTTQLIVRAMSQIRDAMGEAVQEAVQFQRQISLIRTISDGGTFEQISGSVRDISDSFNIPLLETAAGVYQSISNQVGTLGESLKFTAEAAKFARATNSTLANSVDLLSGAIRSYGLSVDDTEKVSGIFFTAIDKGRITANELANAFGRVGPAASQIGISLEEVNAGIATISDRGIKTSETLTQFRGIINALAKPTDAMTAALRELGFATPEAAIGTLRLDGVLRELAKNTDGSAQSFAELFPNLRGVNGAITLSSSGLKTFADNIKAATQNQGEFINQKFAIAVENDGEKLTKAAQQIKNALVVDIGQSAVKTLGEMLDLVGGANSITSAMKLLGVTLPPVVKSATALAVAFGAIKAQALLAAHPLAVVTAGLVALNIATDQTFKTIEKARLQPLIEGAENLGQSGIRAVEQQRQANKLAVQNAEETTKEITQQVLNRLRPVQMAYDATLDKAKDADAQLVADTERSLDRITSARQKFAQALDTAIQNSADQIRESISRIQNVQFAQENREFEFRISGLDDAGKSAQLLRRADELARRAQQSLFTAFQTGNQDLQQRALAQFQAAQGAAEEAQSIAQNNGNRSREAAIVQKIKGIVDLQVSAEQRINLLQSQRQRALRAERDSQAKLTTEIQRQAKIALDNTGGTDDDGNRFSDAAQAKRDAARRSALKRIAELSLNARDFRAADALGLGNLIRDLQDDLVRQPFQIRFDVENGSNQINAMIQGAIQAANLDVNLIKRLGDELGRDVSGSVDEVSRGVIEAGNKLNSLLNQQGQERIRDRQQFSIEQQIESLNSNAARAINNAVSGGNFNSAQVNALRDVITQINTLAGDAKLATADVEALAAKFKQMPSDFTVGKLGPATQALGASINVLRDLATVRGQIRDAGTVNPQEIQSLQALLNDLKNTTSQNTLTTSLQSAETPAQSLSNLARETADQYVRAAAAANSIKGPAVVAKQFGGHYFAKGGYARGVDRVPAMLSRGEMVVNSRSTGKFFSQLQAINAGVQPVYRQQGGNVTNVGDINVTVQGGDSSSQTARQIARDLQREIRRGSSRL
jgi:TP901 family phage tail tape measure protein